MAISPSDLLARCHRYGRGSPEQAEACDVLVRRYAPLEDRLLGSSPTARD